MKKHLSVLYSTPLSFLFFTENPGGYFSPLGLHMCLSSLSRVLSNLRCPLQGSAQATPPWGFCSLPPTLHPLHTPLDPLAQPKPSGDLELLEGKDCAFFISNPIICTWEGFIQCSSNSYLVEWNGYLLPSLWVLVVVMGGGTWF